ncbi:MAG: HAD family hydrolase [Elainella sp. C42_A2020_010]|nr:HAD family hydrolase [Elainella sp. C42_A2020_010]
MVTIRCPGQLFQNIQAIIFDKDGTLASSEAYLRNLAQRRARLIDAQVPGVQEPLLMAFGIDENRINPAGLMAVGTRLENEIAAAAYIAETGKDWVEALQLVHAAFSEADRQMLKKARETPLIEGALELIQKLANAEVKLAILSSDSATNVDEFVEHYNLQSYFQVICGVNQQYPTKSNPQLLQHLSVSLNVLPQSMLMIGDSQVDLEIAIQTCMAGCIVFTGGWTSALSSKSPAVKCTISRFDQIEIG